MRRNWLNYSKQNLLHLLSLENFDIETDNVQSTWNKFETTLINIVDALAPLEPSNNSNKGSKHKSNLNINRKINLRRKLLHKIKITPTNETRDRIKHLNTEIRSHFTTLKMTTIRKKIITGNSKSLWDAVKLSKNINTPKIPLNMSFNNQEIPPSELPDVFAKFFKSKVQSIVDEQVVNDSVYNGKRKIWTTDHHFMSLNNIITVVKTLKDKKCEGHDRIPQKIIKDGIDILKFPLSYLFDQIYTQKKIPEQWLIAKITPIFKKGNKNKIENYRPISNLCSTSKIFEKLILLRINKLEKFKGIDLTGKSQHGFKTKHSTNTAGLKLQSILARALNGDEYALMATLDLSSAFDVVDVELLIKRISILGLPNDMISLIGEWLRTRYFYVGLEIGNSDIHCTGVGTVQGSILGPILYALFVSPIFDLANLTLFADDSYVIHKSKHISHLLAEMKRSIELIIEWLSHSGLKVNGDKTEMCLFYRKDCPPVTLPINNTVITSSPTIKVLGVVFDSKLNWQSHIHMAITKARKSLQGIKLIRKFFNNKELMALINANFYSILYYNADIWLLPSLTRPAKKALLSASAAPLKLCCNTYHTLMSYNHLHKVLNRPTPNDYTKYYHALLLHKTQNNQTQSKDWLDLNFNQNFNARCSKANFIDTSNNKTGKNLISNRLTVINNEIDYNWLNLPYPAFKNHVKKLYLS